MALYTAYPCNYLTYQAWLLLFIGWSGLSYLRHYKAPSYARVATSYRLKREKEIERYHMRSEKFLSDNAIVKND